MLNIEVLMKMQMIQQKRAGDFSPARSAVILFLLYPNYQHRTIFSNTGITSSGASAVMVVPPETISPVCRFFQLPAGRYT